MKSRILLIKDWAGSEKIFYLLLLGIVFIAYGLIVPRMGFYWDDWETIHLARQNTLSAYWNYFQFDRPMMIWTQIVLVTLLGQNPLKWHLFALFVRWLNAVVFYGLLSRLWPNQRWTLRWASLLLVVYPGFTQQALSATYGRYLLISTALFISFWLMLQAIHEPRWKAARAIGAIVLGILQAVSLEYFVGLELLRPLLIYFSLENPQHSFRQTLAKTLRSWVPYITIPLSFLVYRLFLTRYLFPNGDPHPVVFLTRLAEAPLQAMLELGLSLTQNIVFVSLSVWLRQIQPAGMAVATRSDVLAWIGGFGAAAGAAWLILHSDRRESQPGAAALLRIAGLAAAAILVGLIPLLLLGRAPMVGKWSDRFTLPVMYGCALLAVSAIMWLVNGRYRQTALVGFLLGLALTGHIQNSANYARDWKDFKNYFWQLAWRAPQIRPGTAVIGPNMYFNLTAPYSVGFALDQIYGSGADLSRPEYWWLEIEDFDDIPLTDDASTVFKLRNIRFPATLRQSFMTIYPDGKCMQVLDDFYTGTATLSEDPTLTLMLPYASSQAILAGPERSLPVEIFGPEPAHEWCYYYQKADLARQLADWTKVISIYQEAAIQGYEPKDGAEGLPRVEAYLRRSEWGAAYAATVGYTKKTLWFNDDAFCHIWQTLPERAGNPTLAQDAGYSQYVEQVAQLLSCDP